MLKKYKRTDKYNNEIHLGKIPIIFSLSFINIKCSFTDFIHSYHVAAKCLMQHNLCTLFTKLQLLAGYLAIF